MKNTKIKNFCPFNLQKSKISVCSTLTRLNISKIENKRAWIRIVEAFVAIMLIAAVLLSIVNKSTPEKKDISDKIYNTEDAILKSIALDDNMRREVMSPGPNEFDADSPVSVLVRDKTPDYLKCTIRKCNLNTPLDCDFDVGPVLVLSPKQDIYTKSTIITVEKDGNGNYITLIYQPSLLKIFCGLKAEAIQ